MQKEFYCFRPCTYSMSLYTVKLKLLTGGTMRKNTFLTWGGLIHVCNKSLKYKHFPCAPTEPCDWCSSSLPQTQSTVVLIKLCAAFHTSSPTVILGRSQCEGCCKPPHRPIVASISPHWAFQALVSLNQPHLSQRWAWVWLWNVSTVDGPHMGRKRSPSSYNTIFLSDKNMLN